MKKILLLSILFVFTITTSAQLFKLTEGPEVRNSDDRVLDLAFAGGLNQPQFSNIDLNNDEYIDLVLFDRSGQKILTFIAQSVNGQISYSYAPKYEEAFPEVTGFLITRDYNGDDKMDLWLYDTDSVYLYENKSFQGGKGNFPTFEKVKGLKAFDRVQFVWFNPFKSLTPVNPNVPGIEDLDGDGDIDFVSLLNFNGTNMQLFRNVTADSGKTSNVLDFDIVDKCYGGVAEDTTVYLNAECDFGERYNKKHFATKTLLFFDNDNDGDKDLFLGHSEELTNPVYFLENGKADLNYYKDTFIVIDTSYFSLAAEAEMPIAPGMYSVDINQDGALDLICSTNDGDKSSYPIHETQNALFFVNKGTTSAPVFDYQQNDFLVGEMLDFGSHTASAFGDLDGDGDMDMIVATSGDHYYNRNKADYLVKFENIGTSSTPIYRIVDENYLDIVEDSLTSVVPALADLDGDGDLDLFLGSANGKLTYFLNIGSASKEQFDFQTDNFAGIDVGFFSAPLFYDLNKDEVLDLVLGNENGTIHYYRNTGTKTLPSLTLENDSLGGIEMRERVKINYIDQQGNDSIVYRYRANFGHSSPTIVSWGKGTESLAIGGSEGKVRVFDIPTDLDAMFSENEDYMETEFTKTRYTKDWGSRIYPSAVDLNGDGTSDLVIGNSRGGFMVMEGIKGAKQTNNTSIYVKEGFNLFPNPAQKQVTIYASSQENMDFSLLDTRGRVIQSGNVYNGGQIQLMDEIVNGVYFLNLKDSETFFAPQQLIIAR